MALSWSLCTVVLTVIVGLYFPIVSVHGEKTHHALSMTAETFDRAGIAIKTSTGSTTTTTTTSPNTLFTRRGEAVDPDLTAELEGGKQKEEEESSILTCDVHTVEDECTAIEGCLWCGSGSNGDGGDEVNPLCAKNNQDDVCIKAEPTVENAGLSPAPTPAPMETKNLDPNAAVTCESHTEKEACTATQIGTGEDTKFCVWCGDELSVCTENQDSCDAASAAAAAAAAAEEAGKGENLISPAPSKAPSTSTPAPVANGEVSDVAVDCTKFTEQSECDSQTDKCAWCTETNKCQTVDDECLEAPAVVDCTTISEQSKCDSQTDKCAWCTETNKCQTFDDECVGDCMGETSCEECQTKATDLFDQNLERTCGWIQGDDGTFVCQTVEKSTLSENKGDQCKPAITAAPITPPTLAPVSVPTPAASKNGNESLVVEDSESHVGSILGLMFLLGCGAAAFRFKDKILAQLNGAGSMDRQNKAAKYQEVSTNDALDDEEWGWGDDNDDEGIELRSTSNDSMHKRRNTSNESLPKPLQTSPSPLGSSYRKGSPRQTQKMFSTNDHIIPKLPKTITSGTGMSLTKPAYPIPKPGLSLKNPSGKSMAPPPASAPVVPSANFGNMGGMKITSLGPKQTSTPIKKVSAPVASSNDDIFASMGLSAKPDFSHTAASATTKPATTSSRWAAPSPASFPKVTPTVATGTVNTFAVDSGDDDDNWDDDGDLDGLFDD